VVLISP